MEALPEYAKLKGVGQHFRACPSYPSCCRSIGSARFGSRLAVQSAARPSRGLIPRGQLRRNERVNNERIDHFQQITLPWMLIATVDAYSSGGIFQKARARDWIDAALSEHSVLTADANTNNWWRAEFLYALKYVGRLAAE